MKKAIRLLAVLIAVLMLASMVLVACKHKATTKDAAKAELEAYAAAKFAAYDFSTEARAQINALVESGKTAIDNAETDDEVAAALADAKAEIDKIVASSGTLKQYTYNAAFALSPNTWNPHQYQTQDDSTPLDYTTSGWYEFDWNEDHTGFVLVPVMATADPIDVSSTYVGEKWGIEAGETNRAFRIKLNPDAVWDNGVKITADSYIYSMKQLLDPELLNYRASDYYQGSTSAIVGAKNYFYQGQSGWFSAVSAYSTYTEALDSELIFALGNSTENAAYEGVVCFMRDSMGFPDSYTAANVATYLKSNYIDDLDTTAVAAMEGKTLAEIKANATWKAEWEKIIGWWQTEPNEELHFFVTNYTFPTVKFEDTVGLIKVDDYTLDWICTGTLEGYYIKASLGGSFLVYEPLYEACKSQDPETKAWSSTYGTSPDKYMGYGPYKMTKFLLDQVMEFEKSDTWFGFSEKYADTYGTFEREIDGATVPQYQATKIVFTFAKELSTREQMFLKGQLASLGLNDTLLQKYGSSSSLYFAQGAVAYYGIIASDYDNLVKREAVENGKTYDESYKGNDTSNKYNKTILTIKEFRQALAYGINREEVCALMPGTTPGTSLFTDIVFADPEKGITFNSLESTKAAICEYWGVTWGPDGDFATLDAAYKALTGYDPDYAKQLVDIAVDKAIQQGLMHANSIVKLEYGAASESETEKKWYDTFKASFDKLFVGTKLEGKFEYIANYTLGSNFGTRIRTGNVDTAWGFGFSGATLDPFGFLEVFVDSALGGKYQYDSWVDWSKTDITLKLDVDGKGVKEYTYSVADWWQIIVGEDVFGAGLPNWAYGKVDDSIRAVIAAAIEKEVLLNFTTIPLMNQGSAQLKSRQINYGVEEYNVFIGFGGIRFMTFNYSDAEWAAYLQSQGGILTY